MIFDEDISLKENRFKENIVRFFSFWKIYLIVFIISISFSLIFIRYAEFQYETKSVIEILDKAQDSEMSLPTAMTVFNRSMINLSNEKGVLNSFKLHLENVISGNFNIRYFSKGTIKTSEDSSDEWFDNYSLNFKTNTDSVTNKMLYEFSFYDSYFLIDSYDKNDKLIHSNRFDNAYSTSVKNHNLPFEFSLFDKLSQISETKKILVIEPLETTATRFMDLINLKETSVDSDQLEISILYSNPKISENYLNSLMLQFDLDGIRDRQDFYKRTIEFVDSRFDFLLAELESVEVKKQEFKENNSFTDLKEDASLNFNFQNDYDAELFKAKSQYDLLKMLMDDFNDENNEPIPLNIGLEDSSLNKLILDYNNLIKERNRYMVSAGSNNYYVKNMNNDLRSLYSNIKLSAENYKGNLEVSIENIKNKETEFEVKFKKIPKVERILRSIERELEVKEALFLLLFQKREEAAINFAVVKPSIKIIDSAKSSNSPISPNKIIVVICFVVAALMIPTVVLLLWFYFDDKVHIRDHLLEKINSPLIGEIPKASDEEINTIQSPNSRLPFAESFRMIIANLNFTLFNNSEKNNIILITSSIKGEGKTMVSSNLAAAMTSKFKKILLIGADLRNPQIHKLVGVDKSKPGLSNLIYGKENNLSDLILKYKGIDILLSGTIPPNPTELLSSKKFKNFIQIVSKDYDYVIVDSAPCLMVSDTFELSKFADTTIFVIRANFTEKKLLDFINESLEQNKLSNISLVLNSVGDSKSYGYGYKYGYKYNYRYAYNYGYGYGYSDEK